MSDTKNTFTKMLAHWRRKGIARGRYTNSVTGAVCSIQCMREVSPGGVESPTDVKLFLKAADELYPNPQGGKWTDIPVFNDMDGRSTSELYRTAQRARDLRNAGVG